MSTEAQLKLCALYRGMTIKQVLHRLDIAKQYVAQKQTELRINLNGIKIGD